jgi:polyisoprenoid-binding protein YceI
MKLLSNKMLMILLILITGYGYMISCTRDNDLILPIQTTKPPLVNRGTNVHIPGNMTTGNANEWKFDKTHSGVLWSTNYVGASGLLTGRFNQFGIHDVVDAKMQNYTATGQPLPDSSWAFYESEPSKTYFNGYVQINTSNTGEPGRDAGCNLAAMGTTAIVAGTQNLNVTNIAKIKTTEVKFDPESNDYIVTLNLTWKGNLATPLTKSIVGKLKYMPKAKVQFGTATAYDVFGLQLSFQFNCRDFGITSTSISDKIDIVCNANFHNK